MKQELAINIISFAALQGLLAGAMIGLSSLGSMPNIAYYLSINGILTILFMISLFWKEEEN
ncbi:hypothetical protein AB6M97_02930 [Streptococcus hillyeri]|uniref:Uncharacterized protein n=1 Tax=Streptococcus hillyeri TaxID=2282420 RepID=A0A3L9DRV7_9STRE|nr:hypothetical protein [Streptococcus hillyeri]RLY04186.1 hypothetical protein EAF07_03710 [Streptococcus hillyeri]